MSTLANVAAREKRRDREIRVTNDLGRTFVVVLTDREMGPRALVTFYDATYEGDPRFGEFGQQVISYWRGTLLGSRPDSAIGSTGGLDLCGHEPAWKISRHNCLAVVAFLRNTLD